MDLIEIGQKIGRMDAKLDHYHSTVMDVVPKVTTLEKEVEGIKQRAKGVRGIFGAISGILTFALAWLGLKK